MINIFIFAVSLLYGIKSNPPLKNYYVSYAHPNGFGCNTIKCGGVNYQSDINRIRAALSTSALDSADIIILNIQSLPIK